MTYGVVVSLGWSCQVVFHDEQKITLQSEMLKSVTGPWNWFWETHDGSMYGLHIYIYTYMNG